MSATEHTVPIVNGEVVESHATEITHPPAVIPPVPPTLAVAPSAKPAELVARLDAIKEAMETAMVEGVDYGKIPGADKPSLFKPGAEKLAVMFQFDVQTVTEKVWGPDDHLTVNAHTTVFHAPTGARLGGGEGLCTTREKKYAYRNAERTCPECGKANIRRSKNPGEGFYCWRKTDGCGATFPENDRRIISQEVGQVTNPDLPDYWNTAIKMAKKRAVIDAVLLTTGASAIFTQDLEDQASQDPPHESPPDQKTSAPAQAPRTTAKPSERSEPAASGPQKGKVNALMGKAGVRGPEAEAIVNWVGGVAHLDRLSKKKASELIEALREDGSGAQEILNAISTAAEQGDERARKIVARYFEVPNAS